jgi:type II secretory pathway pseudopilin PulG
MLAGTPELHSARPRSGITLLMVVAAIAIAAVLAAAALPTLAGSNRLEQARGVKSLLNSLDSSLEVGGTSFNGTVGNDPSHLSSLNTLLVAGTSQKCLGGTFTATNVTNWKKNALYAGIFIGVSGTTRSGIVTPLANIRDTVLGSTVLSNLLVPPNASGSGTNMIGFLIDSVATEDAQNLNLLYDSGVAGQDSTTGSVRWLGTAGLSTAHKVIILYHSTQC